MTRQHSKHIVFALGGECALLLAAFLLLDKLPAWVLKSALVVAVLLPLVCYLPIVAKPDVYHSWLAIFTEIRRGFFDAAHGLKKCLRMMTVAQLFRTLATMEPWPKTADAWFALPLFPFKVYVLAAAPALRLCSMLTTLLLTVPNRRGFHEVSGLLAAGYSLSFVVLLFGSLIQAIFARRGSASQTLLFFVLGVLMFLTVFPW